MATRAAKKKTAKRSKSARGRTSGRRSSTRSSGSQSARGRRSSTRGRGAQAERNGRAADGHTSRAGVNAITMLRKDHKRVQEMFDRFERTRGDAQKRKLAEQICEELKIHTKIEEEIFYPAVREAIKETELLDEAKVEHQSARDLIRQIERMSAGDEMYDATVKVLGEYVKHHVKEEQNEMFPRARRAGLDLGELAAAMQPRRESLASPSLLSRLMPG